MNRRNFLLALPLIAAGARAAVVATPAPRMSQPARVSGQRLWYVDLEDIVCPDGLTLTQERMVQMYARMYPEVPVERIRALYRP